MSLKFVQVEFGVDGFKFLPFVFVWQWAVKAWEKLLVSKGTASTGCSPFSTTLPRRRRLWRKALDTKYFLWLPFCHPLLFEWLSLTRCSYSSRGLILDGTGTERGVCYVHASDIWDKNVTNWALRSFNDWATW